MNKNIILLFAVVFLIVALVGGGYLWWSIKSGIPSGEPSPTPAVSPEVTLEETITPEASSTGEETKSDLEQIREAFAERYDKPIEEVMVNIDENTGTHASGSISFAGEMGGAMWLAYNDGGGWIITYDGHGVIPCSAVDPYDFPADMVPECWDEITEGLYTR